MMINDVPLNAYMRGAMIARLHVVRRIGRRPFSSLRRPRMGEMMNWARLNRAIENPMTRPRIAGLPCGSQDAVLTRCSARSWISGMTVPKLSMSRNMVKKMAKIGFFGDMPFRNYVLIRKLCPGHYLCIRIHKNFRVMLMRNPLVGDLL